jgi:photosystem II stability/assembly factor-like uncharacterized protein
MKVRLTSSDIALAAALLLAATGTAAAPVGDAWQRPALSVKAPARQALMSAAFAGARVVAVGERGIVALSDDRGITWRQAPSPVSVTLTTVRFADARRGVAVGHAGTVLTTEDAGESWTVRLDGLRLARLAKEAAATPEAMKEAERLLADGPDKPFLDVMLWDAQRLLAVGAYGIAFHSQDGGKSWAPWMARLPNPQGLHWYMARRAGDAIVLAGEQGLLARSDDGGHSFRTLASPYKGSWFTGELRADGSLVLAGLRGNAWHARDGSSGWTQLSAPTGTSITASATAADGTLLLANQAGLLLALRGETLVPVNERPLPMPAAVLPLAPDRALAFGLAGATPVALTSGAKP